MSTKVSPLQLIPQELLRSSTTVSQVIISAKEESGEIFCEVNGKRVEPVDFSLDKIKEIFPEGGKVLLNYEGGYTLPAGKVEGYSRKKGRRSRDKLYYLELNCFKCDTRPSDSRQIKIYSEKSPQNGNPQNLGKPKAQLFELHVTRDLYTYILAFSDASYIRTPLRKKLLK